MILYVGTITFIFGLVLGSFLNCTAMRIVKKEDWVRGRSHCIHCGHELRAKDLVPVFSFLSTGGKCRYCYKKISVRYPVTELAFGLLTLGMYLAVLAGPLRGFLYGIAELDSLLAPLMIFIRNVFLTGCLFIISLVDLEIYEIPDGCLIAGAIAFLVTVPFAYALEGDPQKGLPMFVLHRVLAAVLTLVIILAFIFLVEKALKRDAMGGGDIKLYSLMALYLGYMGSYEMILFSCIAGLLFAVIRRSIAPKAPKELPFAPSIALSGYFLLIFSEAITNWYLSFL